MGEHRGFSEHLVKAGVSVVFTLPEVVHESQLAVRAEWCRGLLQKWGMNKPCFFSNASH
jgi:hypothetical protein